MKGDSAQMQINQEKWWKSCSCAMELQKIKDDRTAFASFSDIQFVWHDSYFKRCFSSSSDKHMYGNFTFLSTENMKISAHKSCIWTYALLVQLMERNNIHRTQTAEAQIENVVYSTFPRPTPSAWYTRGVVLKSIKTGDWGDRERIKILNDGFFFLGRLPLCLSRWIVARMRTSRKHVRNKAYSQQ